jgi:hypothetical protein
MDGDAKDQGAMGDTLGPRCASSTGVTIPTSKFRLLLVEDSPTDEADHAGNPLRR